VLCSAEQGEAGGLGFCGGGGGDDGVQGGRRGIYKAAATLGVRARVWKTGADFARDRGVQLREVDGEPDRWGRPVSGWARARPALGERASRAETWAAGRGAG